MNGEASVKPIKRGSHRKWLVAAVQWLKGYGKEAQAKDIIGEYFKSKK